MILTEPASDSKQSPPTSPTSPTSPSTPSASSSERTPLLPLIDPPPSYSPQPSPPSSSSSKPKRRHAWIKVVLLLVVVGLIVGLLTREEGDVEEEGGGKEGGGGEKTLPGLPSLPEKERDKAERNFKGRKYVFLSCSYLCRGEGGRLDVSIEACGGWTGAMSFLLVSILTLFLFCFAVFADGTQPCTSPISPKHTTPPPPEVPTSATEFSPLQPLPTSPPPPTPPLSSPRPPIQRSSEAPMLSLYRIRFSSSSISERFSDGLGW